MLGLHPGASQEEIKKAYRELVKKYHPDKYQGNPLAELAEEKLQEINEAYDALTKDGSSFRNDWGDNRQSSSDASSPLYIQVRQALASRNYGEAERLLINAPGRDAEWYFLSGVLSYNRGYLADGFANVEQAMKMDPGNGEYRDAYEQMQSAGGIYRSASGSRGYDQGRQAADMMACAALPLCLPCWC